MNEFRRGRVSYRGLPFVRQETYQQEFINAPPKKKKTWIIILIIAIIVVIVGVILLILWLRSRPKKCVLSADCDAGEICVDKICTVGSGCGVDGDCTGDLVCDTDSNTCVECNLDSECPGSQTCESNECEAKACTVSADCEEPEEACDSGFCCIIPEVPTGLFAEETDISTTGSAFGEITGVSTTVSWDAVENADNYTIETAADPMGVATANLVNGTEFTYDEVPLGPTVSDIDLTPIYTYYRVRANGCGTSGEWSDWIQHWTHLPDGQKVSFSLIFVPGPQWLDPVAHAGQDTVFDFYDVIQPQTLGAYDQCLTPPLPCVWTWSRQHRTFTTNDGSRYLARDGDFLVFSETPSTQWSYYGAQAVPSGALIFHDISLPAKPYATNGLSSNCDGPTCQSEMEALPVSGTLGIMLPVV